LISENLILELEPIDQNEILHVHNNLSNNDSLIIIPVIFSTLNELCFLLKNSNFFSILDSSTINVVNNTLKIHQIDNTIIIGNIHNTDSFISLGNTKNHKINEITQIITGINKVFNIDILS
jgi:hypothetical protein